MLDSLIRIEYILGVSLTITQAAERLGVSTLLMKRWDQEGLLSPSLRTPGGHRRYTEQDLEGYEARREANRGTPPIVKLFYQGVEMKKAD